MEVLLSCVESISTVTNWIDSAAGIESKIFNVMAQFY